MRILNAIVELSARVLFFERTQFSGPGLAGSGAIGDHLIGTTFSLHQFLSNFNNAAMFRHLVATASNTLSLWSTARQR